MLIDKQEILDKICYTELVYERINKKLKTKYLREETERLILKILKETDIDFYVKKGKNFYVTNSDNNIIITINSYTFRVITVNRINQNGQ